MPLVKIKLIEPTGHERIVTYPNLEECEATITMFYFPKQHFQILFRNDDGNELINEIIDEMRKEGPMTLEDNPNVVLREMVNDGHMIIEEKPNIVLEAIANNDHIILEHNPLLEYDNIEIKEDEYFSAKEEFGFSESEKVMMDELPLR